MVDVFYWTGFVFSVVAGMRAIGLFEGEKELSRAAVATPFLFFAAAAVGKYLGY